MRCLIVFTISFVLMSGARAEQKVLYCDTKHFAEITRNEARSVKSYRFKMMVDSQNKKVLIKEGALNRDIGLSPSFILSNGEWGAFSDAGYFSFDPPWLYATQMYAFSDRQKGGFIHSFVAKCDAF